MPRFINPVPEYRPNSKLYFYNSNTNTQLVTYKDSLQSIQNAHPVLTDAAGNTPNVFFSGSAKLIVLDENDVQYIERDPVGDEIALGNFADWSAVVTYDLNDIATGSDNLFYLSLINDNTGNDPTISASTWEEIRFISMWNTNVSYAIGDVVQTSVGNLWKSLTAAAANNPETDDGTNWKEATSNPWINKSANFSILANKRYQIDGSGGAVDAALASAYVAGDVIIIHNESISTSLVRLTNTALTIKGPNSTITTADNLELTAGDTAHIVMKTTTLGEFV
jgi:hypothetical protein